MHYIKECPHNDRSTSVCACVSQGRNGGGAPVSFMCPCIWLWVLHWPLCLIILRNKNEYFSFFAPSSVSNLLSFYFLSGFFSPSLSVQDLISAVMFTALWLIKPGCSVIKRCSTNPSLFSQGEADLSQDRILNRTVYFFRVTGAEPCRIKTGH